MLNPTDKIFSGLYCPRCLDACTGYKRFAGKVKCDTCDTEMEYANDPAEWAIINETQAFRAIGHRIMVLEDEFLSGYECSACGGTGHTNVKCKQCKGTKFHKAKEQNGECPDCTVGTSDGRKTFGYEICDVCKGTSGRLIIPDSSKRRPLTGKVISKGREVVEFKVGDRVMFTNYTGTDFEIKGGIKLRVMMDHDVMTEYKSLRKMAGTPETGAINKELADHGVTAHTA